MNDPTKEAIRKQYIEEGGKMIVAAVGDGCVFAKLGDVVAISIRGSIPLDLDGHDEPFIVIRECEIIGRFDK